MRAPARGGRPRHRRHPLSRPAFRRRAAARGAGPRLRRAARRCCWPTSRPATWTATTGAQVIDLMFELAPNAGRHAGADHPRPGLARPLRPHRADARRPDRRPDGRRRLRRRQPPASDERLRRSPSGLARRELRGGLKGFRIFLACLTLGVAAIADGRSLPAASSKACRPTAGDPGRRRRLLRVHRAATAEPQRALSRQRGPRVDGGGGCAPWRGARTAPAHPGRAEGGRRRLSALRRRHARARAMPPRDALGAARRRLGRRGRGDADRGWTSQSATASRSAMRPSIVRATIEREPDRAARRLRPGAAPADRPEGAGRAPA